MIRHLENILNKPGHIVTLEHHQCRFGDGWRPVCIEEHCGYRGGVVPQAKAREIADEHRRKTAPKRGIW